MPVKKPAEFLGLYGLVVAEADHVGPQLEENAETLFLVARADTKPEESSVHFGEFGDGRSTLPLVPPRALAFHKRYRGVPRYDDGKMISETFRDAEVVPVAVVHTVKRTRSNDGAPLRIRSANP